MIMSDISIKASRAGQLSKRRPGKRTVDLKTQVIRLNHLTSTGMTLDQAAETIGVQPITAKRYIQRFNRTTPEAIQARKEEATKKEIETLQKHLDDNYSVYQAAKIMRADPGRIYNLVKENNLRVMWVRPQGRQNRIERMPRHPDPSPQLAQRLAEPGKFPRLNNCIVTECKRVYRQEHAGHRMCRDCRNKTW